MQYAMRCIGSYGHTVSNVMQRIPSACRMDKGQGGIVGIFEDDVLSVGGWASSREELF